MPVDAFIRREKTEGGAAVGPARVPSPEPPRNYAGLRGFIWATVILCLAFGLSLYHLAAFAAQSELYSYILLVPLVSLYLAWSNRARWPRQSEPSRGLAMLFGLAGLAALAGWRLTAPAALKPNPDDALAWQTGAFLLFFLGVGSLFLGRQTLRTFAFPLGFLAFLIPVPVWLMEGIESFLQRGSAAAAYGFFTLAGTPVSWDRLAFQLPGISLWVAPECSGIHSTLVLFMTSLLAGWFFLRTPWKRAVLCLAVIPLALLRNGFRVFVIGELCVHVGPEMIHSYIHQHGGPIFFAASLAPLFLWLKFLIRSERTAPKSEPRVSGI